MTQPALHSTALRVAYEPVLRGDRGGRSDVLAIIGFGPDASLPEDPRAFRVGLATLELPLLEVWRGAGPVETGLSGEVRWSHDGEYCFFTIEVDEAAHGGIAAAAEYAYRCVVHFVAQSTTSHLLRMWNYLDAINLGEGDSERYRLFCEGRARGMREASQMAYPAATAIGRQDGIRILQVYGIACRQAGQPVENPRQVSAWRYPRQYGPAPPTFARGMLTRKSQLLISGTAAVVGHASQHRDDLAAQIKEMLANLDSLIAAAGKNRAELEFDGFLRAYLRNPLDAEVVRNALHARMPAMGGLLLLAGDICRRELLIEIDGVSAVG